MFHIILSALIIHTFWAVKINIVDLVDKLYNCNIIQGIYINPEVEFNTF